MAIEHIFNKFNSLSQTKSLKVNTDQFGELNMKCNIVNVKMRTQFYFRFSKKHLN